MSKLVLWLGGFVIFAVTVSCGSPTYPNPIPLVGNKKYVAVVEEEAPRGSLLKIGTDLHQFDFSNENGAIENDRFIRVTEIQSIPDLNQNELEELRGIAENHGLFVRIEDRNQLEQRANGWWRSKTTLELYRLEDYSDVDAPSPPTPDPGQEPTSPPPEVGAQGPSEEAQQRWINAGLPENAAREAARFFQANFESIPNRRYLVVVDYSALSNTRRLFLLHLATGGYERFFVGHGMGRRGRVGALKTTAFSNQHNSLLTPKGFHLTAETYLPSPDKRNRWGGKALRLQGLERNLNGNSLSRGIVIHGAHYARPSWVEKYGVTGRSNGCPAIDKDLAQDFIDRVKEGTLWYHYSTQ
jgi:hypothetical protein